MAVTYTNFRGDEYYLHARTTKKGNYRYYFKKDDPNTEVKAIPEGYEIYEHPNGRVFLTKKTNKKINKDEITIIEQGLEEYSPIRDFKLDVKKESVYVYTYENPVPIDEKPAIVEALSDPKYKTYDVQLCFTLIDREEREFQVERKFYQGEKEDEWMTLDQSTDLTKLVEKYVQHLGQESFYQLY
ncbi:hypothetical protein J416_08729 [Gracilibacillus halophilus YIM-C55.5]|uniref:Uncharacterized protein n=1 Tax=Gracilibacillus halophilus YIM-C55.5 TaxID=1308866 RepID=N4WUR8_9BACI|nr:hypothetical protein [Gracilibacillus halophilus]ENH96861.1 hypothetical protein J416_08729 [Gracilibacillus halophilus YIM-C55.5]